MSALDFPNTPSPGDTYVQNGVYYRYDGVKWVSESRYETLVTDGIVTGHGTTNDPLGCPLAATAVQPSEVSLVGFSNDYNDLDNKPSYATVASTGDYNDLINIPASVQAVPTGAVFHFAMQTAPTGYLECDGSEVDRTTYADLFAAIGESFGPGDGSTTFRLPDFRGEFIRGWDNGRGVDSGRNFGSGQGSQNDSHSHGITETPHTHAAPSTIGFAPMINSLGSVVQGNIPIGRSSTTHAGNPGNSLVLQSTTQTTGYVGASAGPTGDGSTNITINNSGGSEARPRNFALLACIKH